MENSTIQLKIPCEPEYIGVARLIILGVASRKPFSYDEVEDLRLAVGEACTSAIERAGSSGQSEASITITCHMTDDRLDINVTDDVKATAAVGAASTATAEAADDLGIGPLLMEILVDEIQQDTRTGQGTSITMTKYLGR
ncbi:MAG: ATP-binding protein [Armatimonadetes bacterium]|nr:ATP-binding protein [Armatimonadota bacterium]